MEVLKNDILNSVSFYDFESFICLSGIEKKISLRSSDFIRYCDIRYTVFDKKIIKTYYKNEKLLIDFLNKLLFSLSDSIFVYNYEEKWVKKKIKSKKLTFFLDKYNVNDDNKIVQISSPEEVKMLARSIFRDNTNACFIMPNKKVIIFPSDHMDMFIVSQIDISPLLESILSNLLMISE